MDSDLEPWMLKTIQTFETEEKWRLEGTYGVEIHPDSLPLCCHFITTHSKDFMEASDFEKERLLKEYMVKLLDAKENAINYNVADFVSKMFQQLESLRIKIELLIDKDMRRLLMVGPSEIEEGIIKSWSEENIGPKLLDIREGARMVVSANNQPAKLRQMEAPKRTDKKEMEAVQTKLYTSLLDGHYVFDTVTRALISCIDCYIRSEVMANRSDVFLLLGLTTADKEDLLKCLTKLVASENDTSLLLQPERKQFRSELLNQVDEIVFFDPCASHGEQLTNFARLPMSAGPHIDWISLYLNLFFTETIPKDKVKETSNFPYKS
ncbi:hypothetical protein CCACVL1_18188 [Corchorus capsularis]|uniref:Uncharacterized protein n=1 Tax=Corchorus capsularis TaxID=210143 RepID=A0A1R3HMA7_COCAP|nr:hypothetical protein CCACVL1_18188 [Corchorus capsularis]